MLAATSFPMQSFLGVQGESPSADQAFGKKWKVYWYSEPTGVIKLDFLPSFH